jgi:hypothetical protein
MTDSTTPLPHDAVVAFGRTGDALMRLVRRLAEAADGRVEGLARVALEALRIYAEAGRDGMAALGETGRGGMSIERHLSVQRLGTAFREALGVLATAYAGGDTVVSLAALGQADEDRPDRLRRYFALRPPPVEFSAAARGALDALRQDPLVTVANGPEWLLERMAEAAAGVTIREDATAP